MKSKLLDLIKQERLADDIWELVNVHSPTMNEKEAADRYAEMLTKTGAEVEVDRRLPESPNVVGRLKGSRPGATLQLAGHLDHIDVDHPPPKRDGSTISGRGSADMKCGLAGILEIVRILKDTGCDFPGEVLVTAYGLHEAPNGDFKGLLNLVNDGVIGNAALIFEGAEEKALVMGKGQGIWNLRVVRDGEVCHELRRAPEADALIEATARIVSALIEENASLTKADHDYPLLGPQSIFIGQIHYGDFYNRAPREATLQGTRRWHPDRTISDVQMDMKTLLSKLDLPANLTIEESWVFVGEGYSIDPNEEIVGALTEAYQTVTGKTMPIAGGSSITDVNRIIPFGKIPAVPVGFDGQTAHADFEYVRLDRVKNACKIAMQTVLNYLERMAGV